MSEVVIVSGSDCELVETAEDEGAAPADIAEELSPNSRLARTRRVIAAGGAEPSSCVRRPLPKAKQALVLRGRQRAEARARNHQAEQLRIQQAQRARRERRLVQQRQREERRRLRAERVRPWIRLAVARRRRAPKAKAKTRRVRDRDLPTRSQQGPGCRICIMQDSGKGNDNMHVGEEDMYGETQRV